MELPQLSLMLLRGQCSDDFECFWFVERTGSEIIRARFICLISEKVKQAPVAYISFLSVSKFTVEPLNLLEFVSITSFNQNKHGS